MEWLGCSKSKATNVMNVLKEAKVIEKVTGLGGGKYSFLKLQIYGAKMIINENCPCKRKKCERHGKCDECRKHHAESERQRPVYCEKKKKE